MVIVDEGKIINFFVVNAVMCDAGKGAGIKWYGACECYQ